MKPNYIFLILILSFALISIGIVSAVECNADLSQGGDSCTVSSSLTLNGSYIVNMNGSSTVVGAIHISTNNILFDCNGTTIYGNWSSTEDNYYIGISVDTVTNLTLKNCNITNYNYGIRFKSSSGNLDNFTFVSNKMGIYMVTAGFSGGSNITNSLFYYNNYTGIWFYSNAQDNLNIKNNLFYYSGIMKGGIYEEPTVSNSKNINIDNNTFYQVSGVNPSIRPFIGVNWIISNNKHYGSSALGSFGFDIYSNNSLVFNNYMTLTHYGIRIRGYNSTVLNNTIENGDQGSSTSGLASFVYFINNTFKNMTQNYDSYNVGLKIFNSSNIFLIGNNFSGIATAGVLSQASYNVSILNNNFDFIPLSQRSSYLANDGDEPRCAIQSTQRFRGYFNQFGNYNLTVSGNVFDVDTPCYLYLENQTLLTTDISNYWYRSFITPLNLFSGGYEFYIPNYYNNLSGWNGNDVYYNLISDLGGFSNYTSYRVFKDYLYVYNRNGTSNMINSFPGLTSALLTNSTSICNGSNSNLALNTGNINITLNPNEECYVLDNYNLTEGITRDKSPIWFSSSTEESKKIASNLTDTINITITISADCETVGTIVYSTHTSSYTRTWNHGDYICLNNRITFTNIPVETASGSNTFSLSYNQAIQTICSDSDLSFIEAAALAGILFTIVLIGGVVGILFMAFSGTIDLKGLGDNLNGISLQDVITGILIIGLLFLVIATMAFLIGGSYCPAIGG